MKQFLKKLNEPFPESDSPRENFRHIIIIGLFITFFLYFFQIGGMEGYPGSKFLMCLNFGLITVVIAMFYDWLVGSILKINRNDPSWTLKRWIIYIFILLILISIGNYSYYAYISKSDFLNLNAFLLITLNTIAVGMFPVVFSGMLIQINANQKNQIQAARIQSHLPKNNSNSNSLQLLSSQKNQNFEAPINDILYLEAMQNYVSICFLMEGKIKKEMLRSTIKNIESQVENTPLIRCHRSFIVNSNLIKNVEGNAQGLRLRLTNLDDFEVPVSRKYIPILRKII